MAIKPDKCMVILASDIVKAIIAREWHICGDQFSMDITPDKTLRVKVDPEVYVVVSNPENNKYTFCLRSYEGKGYGEDPDTLQLEPVDSLAKAAQEVIRIRSIYKTYRKDLEKIQGNRLHALKWERDKKEE